jgi:DNA-binding protein HU-beta
MKSVSKAEVVEIVSQHSGKSKAVVNDVMGCFLEVVADLLAKGDKVSLTGWLQLHEAMRKARMGINPKTKQKVKYPAKKYIKVKLGNKWKNPEKMGKKSK